MADVSTITANGVTYNIKDTVARAGMNNILTISVGSFSSLPKTINNAAITSDYVLLSVTFTDPSAIAGNLTWTTSAGKIVLSGSMTGATAATLVLGKSAF